MSNLIVTNAGAGQLAAKQAAGQPLLLRKLAVSADTNSPDVTWTSLPQERATQYDINTVGKMPDENSVLYATTLDTTVGDFDIVLVGLYDADGILILVDQIPTFQKLSGVSGNIFRHTCIVDFSNYASAEPVGIPTAQFHPETQAMAVLRADMEIAVDVATSAVETMQDEVPDIKDRLTDIENTYNNFLTQDGIFTNDIINLKASVQQNADDIADANTDLSQQIKTIDILDGNGNVTSSITQATANFTGELVGIDSNNNIVFDLPTSLKGFYYRLDIADPYTRGDSFRFITDDYILLKRETQNVVVNGVATTEEQITFGLDPDELKGFGTISVTGVNSLTTLSAEGLNQVLNLVAGNGMELQADDSSNTVTISSNNSEGFQSVVVTEANYTSTLTSSNTSQLRIEPDGNIELSTISTTNTIKIKSIGFGEILVRALDPNNDASLSGSDQTTLAFTETDTVRVRLEGYGTSNQAIRFDTVFPDEINKSFTIEGGNLHISKDTQQLGGFLYCEQIHCAGEIVGFSTTTPSDEELKTDLRKIDSPLEMLSAIHGYRFKWSQEMVAIGGKEDVGLLAQEVEKVLPEAVSEIQMGDTQAMVLGVDYQKLVPLLVGAVNELTERVKTLEEELRLRDKQ